MLSRFKNARFERVLTGSDKFGEFAILENWELNWKFSSYQTCELWTKLWTEPKLPNVQFSPVRDRTFASLARALCSSSNFVHYIKSSQAIKILGHPCSPASMGSYCNHILIIIVPICSADSFHECCNNLFSCMFLGSYAFNQNCQSYQYCTPSRRTHCNCINCLRFLQRKALRPCIPVWVPLWKDLRNQDCEFNEYI